MTIVKLDGLDTAVLAVLKLWEDRDRGYHADEMARRLGRAKVEVTAAVGRLESAGAIRLVDYRDHPDFPDDDIEPGFVVDDDIAAAVLGLDRMAEAA